MALVADPPFGTAGPLPPMGVWKRVAPAKVAAYGKLFPAASRLDLTMAYNQTRYLCELQHCTLGF